MGGINLYEYVGNSPLGRHDPTGMFYDRQRCANLLAELEKAYYNYLKDYNKNYIPWGNQMDSGHINEMNQDWAAYIEKLINYVKNCMDKGPRPPQAPRLPEVCLEKYNKQRKHKDWPEPFPPEYENLPDELIYGGGGSGGLDAGSIAGGILIGVGIGIIVGVTIITGGADIVVIGAAGAVAAL